MFTKSNSINDIMDDYRESGHLGMIFPLDLIEIVPSEMRVKPLEELDRNNFKLPWGHLFPTGNLVKAANTVLNILEGKEYYFVPLWKPQEDGYFPENDNSKDSVTLLISKQKRQNQVKPAVILCPGGGYENLSTYDEGIRIAQRMEQAGYRAFILNYRRKPNYYPAPQEDMALALKYVRVNAEKYNINPDNILLIGSSAGGHLCASLSVYYDKIEEIIMAELRETQPEIAASYEGISVKPDKLCLCYPLITFEDEDGVEVHNPAFQSLSGGDESLKEKLSVELHVDKMYPDTFIWACEDDGLVPITDTTKMAAALKQAGVHYEMHLYPSGGHGCGLADGTSAEGWMKAMLNFMKS